MISKIEDELAKYDSEIGSKLNLVKPNMEGQISIGELEETLRVIQAHPNDERINKIIQKLDSDKDGKVALDEILALVDEGKEGHGEILKKDEKKESAPVAPPATPAATSTAAPPPSNIPPPPSSSQ
jgi:Ca2+-binding EF-hand superfamily protein